MGGNVIQRQQHENYKPHARINQWKPVSADDIKSFVAHMIILGIVRKPDLEDYWSKRGIMQTPFFGKYMSRNRFQCILSNLHLADDQGNPAYGQRGHNPLAKIQPFVDMLTQNFCNVYKPGCDISIHEGCCPWKGPLSFRVFNPKKLAKFHIKLFQVSDPGTGYVVHFKVYTGKNSCWQPNMTTSEEYSTTTTKTVMTLCHDAGILDKGHRVYFDKSFTSPHVMHELWTRGTAACGIAAYCAGAPDIMKIPKGSKSVMKPGQCEYRRKGPILALKFHQKRTISILTTVHKAILSFTGKIDRVTGEPIYKPQAAIEYARKMRGVDQSDQLMNNYHFLRRTWKWWRKLWIHLLNMAIRNAYILNNTFGTEKMSHNEYRHYLARKLLGIDTLGPPPGTTLMAPINTQGGHYPDRLPHSETTQKIKTRICVLCKTTSKNHPGAGIRKRSTTIQCDSCEVPLCIYPCFALFHKQM